MIDIDGLTRDQIVVSPVFHRDVDLSLVFGRAEKAQ
jgi:hypothetical protein